MLAFATCIYNNISVDIAVKRQRKYTNPIARLVSFMNSIQRETEYPSDMTIDELKFFNKFMEQEINMFFTSLCVNGWDTNMHSFYIDQWRVDWKSYSAKIK
ncbi:hypothetical protein WA026_022146 [Henosepilachna vigintioctopunctata]|uniref:Root UVB sensitive protein C-terminal domain-containing protein n=1 Tax=Henosepilachna vigintioctopunctata TaxID=420089 RepID=A0AAW1TP85_9CUCU